MMLDLIRKLLLSSLAAAALPLGACVDVDRPVDEPVNESLLDPAERAWLDDSTEERFTLTDPEDVTAMSELAADDAVSAACGIDAYFHPNNGARGGWIEGWRLCHRGGNTWQICTGGYAPVRYWNPSACGGTVHDWYPQGWHGWVQTAGGCC